MPEVRREVVFLADSEVRAMLTVAQALTTVEEDFQRQAQPEAIQFAVPLAYGLDDCTLGMRTRLKAVTMRDLGIVGVRVAGYKIDANGFGDGGEPESTRYVILSKASTGSPLAIVDEHWTFKLRAAAAIGVAAKYLARADSKVVGLIGVGHVGEMLLWCLKELFRIEEVRVMSRHPNTRQQFAAAMCRRLGLPTIAVNSYEDVCRDADIVLTCTPSDQPFVDFAWLKAGVFAAGVGHEEMMHNVYTGCDRFFVDYDRAKQDHPRQIKRAIAAGAIAEADISGEIWEVVSGRKPGRRSDRERILVETVGLTSQDVALAYWLYQQAEAEGRGLRLPA